MKRGEGKYFWLLERYNPQLGTYYINIGRMLIGDARRREKSIYGYNTLHRFSNQDDLDKKVAELRADGFRVQ